MPVGAAPSAGIQVPRTLAHSVPAGDKAVDPRFPVDFVAVTWAGEHGEALVRFRHGTTWSPWEPMGEDGAQEPGRFSSALVPADDADAYQVRVPGGAGEAKAVAINTTDGPTMTVAATTEPTPAFMGTVQYVPRSAWGADESLRLEADGTETWPEVYFPVQKLTVHHTATANGDTDPAATVRAIYRYHTVDNGWGDIGYQFLVDESGRIYEGRHTDDDPNTAPAFGDSLAETDPDEDMDDGVVGAHVSGFNSGNLGVSMLGTLTDRRPTAGAQRGVEQILAELAGRTAIDPTGAGTYDNPASDDSWTGPNIPGHRDFAATECPGGIAHALLPVVRDRTAARMAGGFVEDTASPTISSVSAAPSGTRATVTWLTTGDASDSQLQYWVKGRPNSTTTTQLDLRFVESHSVPLSGLRKRTTYEYRVISADIAGNRRDSTVGSFTIG